MDENGKKGLVDSICTKLNSGVIPGLYKLTIKELNTIDEGI